MNLVIVLFVLNSMIASIRSQFICTTPNGETGRCISIRDCKVIYNSLRTHRSPADRRFLQESFCGRTDRYPHVCCGSTVGYKSSSMQARVFADPSRHRNVGLLPSRGQCGRQGLLNKIFGGNETDINEFPWMALIEYRMGSFSTGLGCGGVLINKRYVLTAAHCVKGAVEDILGELYSVRLGEYDQRTDEDCITYPGDDPDDKVCADAHQDIPVEEVIAHEQYDTKDPNILYDIALVRLSKDAEFNGYVQPICLPLNGESTPAGQNLTVAGWGTTETDDYSPIKLKVDVPVLSESECERVYTPLNKRISSSQLCAGNNQGMGTCNGDSGGPIMTTFADRPDYYLEGIVSYGPADCGTAPGVYTKVSQYVNWIMDNMKQ